MLEIDVSDSLQKAETLLESMPGAAERPYRPHPKVHPRCQKRCRAEGQRTLYYQAILRDADHESNVPGLIASLVSKGPVNDLSYFRHNPGTRPNIARRQAYTRMLRS